MKYRIQTESLKYYDIHDNGNIERLDIKHTPSNNWQCIGFRKIKPFGYTGVIITPADLLQRSENGRTTFKNGKGKYILVDYDHGTVREWGDHITAIWEVK